jgi:hypothetical protein
LETSTGHPWLHQRIVALFGGAENKILESYA